MTVCAKSGGYLRQKWWLFASVWPLLFWLKREEQAGSLLLSLFSSALPLAPEWYWLWMLARSPDILRIYHPMAWP